MTSDVAVCAHINVAWKTERVGLQSFRGWWECDLCHTKFVSEPLMEYRLKQAESEALALVAAENEACAKICDDVAADQDFPEDEEPLSAEECCKRRIRSRLTAPQVAALAEHDANLCRLDKMEADGANRLIDDMMRQVGAEYEMVGGIRTRNFAAALEKVKAEARLDEQKKHGGHLHGCNAIVGGGDYCNCGFKERIAELEDALSAQAVPDGAAKGDGDGR